MSRPAAKSGSILLVSEVFPPAIGGSGALLENVYRRLPGRHVRVIAHPAAAGRYAGPLEVTTVPMVAPDWGVLRPASLRCHLRITRAIRRALAAEPALVHCGRALPEGLSTMLAAPRRPFVCWLHGEELGYSSTSRELSWLATRVYRRAAAIVANSHNSKRLLVADWGIAADSVHVVHPGVDIDRFHPGLASADLRARVAGPDDVLFVSVGRLQRRKGHDMVLRALGDLRSQLPSARLAIVGDGPERGRLEAEAAALGVADIVTFVGESDEADLPRWHAAADVFVMANRTDGVDFEGFGIVFLEAAATATPVIAGQSGGAPEAVEDGATGLVVDGADPIAIRGAMLRLATSPALRRQFGEAGRARVVSQFTWSHAAARLDAIHERVAAITR
jgi:phosphatidylinositol alpha-1,6-mannosyltransferase